MRSHRPWFTLLTKRTPILSWSQYVALITLLTYVILCQHARLSVVKRYEETIYSFTKDHDRRETELYVAILHIHNWEQGSN